MDVLDGLFNICLSLTIYRFVFAIPFNSHLAPPLSLAAERFIFKRVPVLILISRLMILFFCWFCIVEVFSCHTRIYR